VLELHPDCTLRSVFALLRRCPLYQELVPGLASAVKEAEELPQDGCVSSAVKGLSVAKSVEITGYPGAPRVDVYLRLEGEGKNAPELRFLQLGELLDIPLRLGGARHILLGEAAALVCEASFTLFELIECIGWELGFQGGSLTCNIER